MKKEVLNLKRIFLILTVLFLVSILAIGCTTTSDIEESEGTEDTTSEMAEDLPVFTLEELAKYNGKDGNPAYVGYEGKVYDVSDIEAWKGGIHQNQHEAGKDYTDVLNNQAPHAPTNLTDNAPVVGTLE